MTRRLSHAHRGSELHIDNRSVIHAATCSTVYLWASGMQPEDMAMQIFRTMLKGGTQLA